VAGPAPRPAGFARPRPRTGYRSARLRVPFDIRPRVVPRLAILALSLVGVLPSFAPPDRAGAAPVRAAGGPEVSVIATGLDVPWDIAFLPDGRALVTERPGSVRLVGADGKLTSAPAALVSVNEAGDGGLTGIAVDPAFAAGQPFVYLYATVGNEMQVQRWRMSGDELDPDGLALRGIRAGGIHNSGRLRFGPDGALYLGTGDAGDGWRAQDPGSLNGKLLRLPPGSYRGAATPERLAMGLRHPQGFAWQPGSDRLFATDHGPSDFDGPSGDDELDLIVAGANYGWPDVRGADHKAFTAPAYLWVTTIAPSGITFVTQPGSSWTGNALVSALRGQQLRRLTFKEGAVIGDEPLFVGSYGRLRAVAEAPDGAIWVTTSNRDVLGTPIAEDDRILRIVPPAAPATAATPGPPRACPRARVVTPGPRARRLLADQRIAQAALRRLRGVEARLTGVPVPPARCRRAARVVRATPRQLLITQRIAQTALRLHAVLSARVAGRQPPRAAATRRRLAGLRYSPRQAAINHRIALTAARRATALAARVEAGGP
jgi:glucose/arabinose dehydrogenase